MNRLRTAFFRLQRMAMQDKTDMLRWLHQHIPFAAMLATEEIGKRPLLTRLVESVIVAVAAGALSAYVTINVLQAVHSSQIDDLRRQIAQEHEDSRQWFELLQDEISGIPAEQLRQRQKERAVPGS